MTSRFLNVGGLTLGMLAVAVVALTVVFDSLSRSPDLSAGLIRPASGPISYAADPNAPLQALSTVDGPASPFDRFLLGDTSAISAIQKRGFEVFKSVGCAGCHQGRQVGGNMLQRFGIFGDPFAGDDGDSDSHLGRFNIGGDDADRHVFLVASLRDVALTAPYFHDGSATTLQGAVQIMARYQLGRNLSAADVTDIVAFLQSLSGLQRWVP